MKNMTGFSLFWKIYLTLLLVLFLPFILFTLSHMTRDRDRDRDVPPGIVRHLEWSAAELAEQAESVPDERMASWLESVESAIGLEICARRDDEIFYLPGSEWLASYEPDEAPQPPDTEFKLRGLRPPSPPGIVVSSFSRSGRTEITAALTPFRGVRPRNVGVFLSIAVICVALSFMLVRNFMTPLSELRRTTLDLANGELSVRVGRNVTDRGDEIADLGRSFNKMAERVEALVLSQKRLLSDISHEIRSPLQRMEVASALLRDKCGNPRPYIDRIELEISRVDEMVEELLTLTRADETPLAKSERVALDEVIGSILADAEFESGVKTIAADIPKISVPGDATLLSRALRNVIHNAIRCTAPGTGVEIDARREGSRVVVTVRDHGPGVSEKELDKIFLPYYRTDEARERSRGGTGLGLAITKRIVERHGGEVAASNAPSGGLLVTVNLEGEPEASSP
ncbi:MAG: HAMP domain-containing protein [Synergistaceae bacterium]|jgi:two-component system sensor histidine kinase CpxA|nr:HAMP domain-containing protein [Synergistaceae bacterium]